MLKVSLRSVYFVMLQLALFSSLFAGVEGLRYISAIFIIPLFVLSFALVRDKERFLLIFFAGAGSLLISNVLVVVLYGVDFSLEFIGYFVLSFSIFCSVCDMARSGSFGREYLQSFRYTPYIAAVYFGAYFVYMQYSGEPLYRLSYGFDDKSHAVVFIMFMASLLVLQPTPVRLLLICALVFLSLATLSRLVFIYIPFLSLAILWSLKGRRTLFLIFGIAAIAFLFIWVGYSNLPYIDRAFSRISGEEVASNSTFAHLLLIWYGLQLKVLNITNFIFGVSPGGFAAVLEKSNIDYSMLSVVDPNVYSLISGQDSFKYYVPIHSTLGSFFVEFPLYVFILYLALNVAIVSRLVKKGGVVGIMLFGPFLLSTMFYSTLNEFFFFVITSFFYVLSLEWRKTPDQAMLFRRRWDCKAERLGRDRGALVLRTASRDC